LNRGVMQNWLHDETRGPNDGSIEIIYIQKYNMIIL
jgi:hypothetical protein